MNMTPAESTSRESFLTEDRSETMSSNSTKIAIVF